MVYFLSAIGLSFADTKRPRCFAILLNPPQAPPIDQLRPARLCGFQIRRCLPQRAHIRSIADNPADRRGERADENQLIGSDKPECRAEQRERAASNGELRDEIDLPASLDGNGKRL